MLKETYMAELKAGLPPGAMAVVVTRNRGHVLSPSWALLNDYKANRVTWEEYDRRFRIEMAAPAAVAEMKRLKKLAKDQDVYLVGYEKEPPCHRFILLDLMSGMDE
jgi:uncharacterized protein YeaO (DUF488 family)